MSGDELDIKQLFSYKKNYKRGAAYLFGKSQMKKTFEINNQILVQFEYI